MFDVHYPADAFGDPFDLGGLPLPRPARGYGVQLLDTDLLLDTASGDFLPVRSPDLDAAHASFAAAHAAAARWAACHGMAADAHRLAIVPVGYDDLLQRHVLIYGVLCGQP
jgi:hypothetical protein